MLFPSLLVLNPSETAYYPEETEFDNDVYFYAMPRQYTMLAECPYVIVPLFKCSRLNGEWRIYMNKQVIYDLFEEKIKEQPESGVLIKRIETKSVLTKSNQPVSDYSVTPYVGCTHACKYCYVSFMKRFTNHGEPWGEFPDARVGFSINTLDEAFKDDMDQAVSIERRLLAMKKLHDAGVRTTCFISPIFPGITDVTAIIDSVKKQCNLVWLENLNLRGSYKTAILAYIREKHPDLVPLSFDAPPVIVNFFYHEEIKKSAKKGGKKNA